MRGLPANPKMPLQNSKRARAENAKIAGEPNDRAEDARRMAYYADLHIHSSYAYATSRELTFENLARWARRKGVDMLASADFTHPAWFAESCDKLAEAGDGVYEHGGVKFVLGTEVSCVARVGGRGRRVHLLAFAPSLAAVGAINKTLRSRGAKLDGDGRPTLTMPPRDLLALMLDADPRCFVIPAHVWTPWYGIFGAKSGFDSLESAFGDLTPLIPAVETGLSADPAMCWRVPDLDDRAIVSFSDAHSLPKLARELTAFEGEPGYDNLADALRNRRISHTLEFFPEEGKYHNSGHRACGVSLSPRELSANGGDRCPKCGRSLTLGVTARVDALAQRDATATRRRADGMMEHPNNDRPPYRSLVSLDQVLSETLGVGTKTKRVRTAYKTLTDAFGNELAVLLDAPIPDLSATIPAHGERLAESIARVRAGDVHIEPGYDGRYGTVKIWRDEGDGGGRLF